MHADDGGGQHFATIEARGKCVIVSFPSVEAIIMSDKAYILKGGLEIGQLMRKHFYNPADAVNEEVALQPWQDQVLECCLMQVPKLHTPPLNMLPHALESESGLQCFFGEFFVSSVSFPPQMLMMREMSPLTYC